MYFAAVVIVLILLRVAGDRWWLATMLTYGPRWVLALPLGILMPVAARQRALVLLFLGLVLVAGPVTGLCVPARMFLVRDSGLPAVRVLTCNVQGEQLDLLALGTLIDEIRPDVVALQECSPQHGRALFGRRQGEWHVRTDKGLCLASRYPVREAAVLGDEPGWRDIAVRYDLETPGGVVHFFNLHLATPRTGLEAVLREWEKGIPALRANTTLRWKQSGVVSRFVDQVHGPTLVAGDFNMPGDSPIYRRFWSHYSDAFSSAGLGWGHTRFTRWFGIRIDHVLAGPEWRFRRCWVGPDIGSDHRPVIADVEFIGRPA